MERCRDLKVYVHVKADFDESGRMLPQMLIWEPYPGRKGATGEDPGAAADGKHQQHGRHPESVQGDHRGVHGERLGGGAGG